MENAAKALLIAGGVMIAILLLTLFAYIFSHIATSTSSIYSTLEESEITKFNQQFLNYEGRGVGSLDPLTIQDVVTIINLAKDNNKSAKRPTTIKVKVNGNDWTDENTNNLLENYMNNQYKCNTGGVQINRSTLLVEEVGIVDYP